MDFHPDFLPEPPSDASHDALDQLVYHLGTCRLSTKQKDRAYYLIRIVRSALGNRDDVVLTVPSTPHRERAERV
jgi:hypothetical protein